MSDIDFCLHASRILPIVPENSVLEAHCICVGRDGVIAALMPSSEARQRYPDATHEDLGQRLLMPGLVNAHGHAAMTLLRGLADDQPLKNWLEDHIWPAEARWVDEAFVLDGTRLAIAEMLLSGTTCFSDMYFFPDAAAKAITESGIRAQVAFPIIEFQNAWAKNADDHLFKGMQVRDDFKTNPRLSFAFGPHAPYTTTNQTLERVLMYAEELDSQIQIHLHEAEHEISESISEHGQRPIARLHELGLMSPRLQAVHMTQLSAEDITTVADTGTHVIHCPSSNLKLASGLCPVPRLLENGVNVAIGTDGAASNNMLDMFSEARLTALAAKISSGKATALPAHEALRMATIYGARALGLDDHIGSLEVGKAADLIAIDLERLECGPVYDPHSTLIYTATGSAVSDVWVSGKRLVKQRTLQTLDSKNLGERMRAWGAKIASADAAR